MSRCFSSRLCPLLLTLLSISSIVLIAQNNAAFTRIQVKRGGPVATVEGDVDKDKEVIFVFEAKAGSKFSGHLTTTSGKAGFAVDDPDGIGLPEEEFDFNTSLTGRLEKTGDYKVTVATFDLRRVHFKLVMRVY